MWRVLFLSLAILLSSAVADDDLSRNLRHRKQKACVSLFVYRDGECKDGPVRSITFPTWTKPGSSCYTDASMAHYSVKDQYCDLDTGNWHETVFAFDTQCKRHWYSPVAHLEFAPGKCVGGYELDYCQKGKCPKENEDGSPVIEELVKDAGENFPIIQNGGIVMGAFTRDYGDSEED